MRILQVLSFYLLLGTTVFGQAASRLDSLRQDLEQYDVGDTLRFKTLALLWRSTVNNDLSGSINYGRQLLREAVGSNNEEWTAVGNRFLGISQDYLGKSDSSLYHYAQALPYYRATNNILQSGVLLFNTAIIHQDLGGVDSAKYYLSLADSCFVDPAYLIQRSAVNKLRATIEREQGNEDDAVRFASKAYELAREGKDSSRMADAEQEIAFAYQGLNDYQTSAAYFKRSLEFYERNNDTYFALVSLVNLATCYQAMDSLEQAIAYGERGLSFLEIGGMGDLEVDFRNTLGNIYWKAKNYLKAEDQ
ncbi:MAG: tetratricopeptide repeat protein, partial [Bacteroidota bacterium]